MKKKEATYSITARKTATCYTFALWSIYIIISIILSAGVMKLWTPMWGDWWYYTDIARSIANTGTIRFANFFGVNTAYLYPAILSLAYKLFYDPYTITFTLRIFGVFMMTSVIFPTYLLCVKMGASRKCALLLSSAAVLIPDMIFTWMIMSETVAYPLFMWTVYIVYLEIENNNKIWLTALIGVMFHICYIARSQFLMLPISYIFVLAQWAWRQKNDRNERENNIRRILIVGLVFSILYFGVPKALDALGIMRYTESTEASMFNMILIKLKNDPVHLLLEFITGNVCYFLFLLLGYGVFTFIVPIFYREFPIAQRKLRDFLNLVLLSSIELMIITMFFSEETLELGEYRVHLRYCLYFFIPYLALLYSIDFSQYKLKKAETIVLAAWFLLLFFVDPISRIKYNAFLGHDNPVLSIIRAARSLTMTSTFWAYWLDKLIIMAFAVVIFVFYRVKPKKFFTVVFPLIIVLLFVSNYIVYTDWADYVTRVGQGDYVGRYAPIAEYINQYEEGEAVVLNWGSIYREEDNEMQSFLLFPRRCLECISFEEIDRLTHEEGNDINLWSFDRDGFIYVEGTNQKRKLDKAKVFIVFKNYKAVGYEFSNEIVYEDDWFDVYKLDDGVLHRL